MSKVFKAVGTVASVLAIIPGPHQPIAMAVATVATIGAGLTAKKPKPPRHTAERLHATFDPLAPRKSVFGITAFATDLRYQAYTGTDQEFCHQILCVASHQVEAIDELWFDSEIAWSAAGGVSAKYAGYLQVTVRNPGTSSNGIAIDGVWTASCTLTGCAYLHLRYKMTGNSKKAESPFASSIPSRVTVRGKGARVPDLRVPGVSLSDQSTWVFAGGRNPAWQLLFNLIGWKINGKLALGRGMPAARIDLDSFITAANMCDEAVAKAAGGTEPRYRADGVFSEADSPGTVTANLRAAMNAELRDDGGKLSLHVRHNDLGTAVALGPDDILGAERWDPMPEDEVPVNIVRGNYVDSSDAALYQPAPWGEVSLPSPDGMDRPETLDLMIVQSPSQAQRLAKQWLQRKQYPGRYSALMGPRAWKLWVGRPVALTLPHLGWENKLFRVISPPFNHEGAQQVVLQEEHASIYAWDQEEAPAVQAAVPTVYDPLKAVTVQALAEIDDLASRPPTYHQDATPTDPLVGETWTRPSDSPRVTRRWNGLDWEIVANLATTGSHVGVADGATRGRNLIRNAGADNGTVEPWAFDPASIAVGGAAWMFQVTGSGGATGGSAFLIDKESAGQGVSVTHPALPVEPGRTYLLRAKVNGYGSAGGFYFGLRERATGPSGGYVHIDFQTGASFLFDNAALPNALVEREALYTVPAGVKFVSPFIATFSPGLDLLFDEVEFYELTDHELNADITSTIVGVSEIVIEADHTGAPIESPLSRNTAFKLQRADGSDVTAAASWTRTIVSGGYSGTIGAANGVLNTTGLTTNEAVVRIAATYQGKTYPPHEVRVRKNIAPPPTGGSGGSGTTGGTTASASSFSAISTTSMATIATMAPVTVSSAGKVKVTVNLSPLAEAADPAGTFDVAGIVQRNISGTWTDVGTEASSNPDPWVSYEPEMGSYFNWPGTLAFSVTVSGLTPGSAHEFRLRARNTTAAKFVTFSGNLVADGTVA